MLRSPRAVTRAVARVSTGCLDLGDVLLTPGLVNAHAHLELSGLRGALSPGLDFGAWVGELLRLRAARGPRRMEVDAALAGKESLEFGVTTVGDIDTTGAGERGLAGAALRTVLFRELLDAHDPARTAGELKRVRRALPRRARRTEGLAPHAPFTVSPALLAGVAKLAARRRVQVSVHWSETAAEVSWMTSGAGPLAAMLGPSPKRSGLDLLEQVGLLGPGLALVHGNHPTPGEPGRIAAAGATLVHCPGTHAWFGREAAPLASYRRAGVTLALGSDSLASNESLDLWRELRLVLAADRGCSPTEAWAMATTGAARALGMGGEIGELVPGARADFAAHELGSCDGSESLLGALIEGQLALRGVWVGGRRVASRPLPDPR